MDYDEMSYAKWRDIHVARISLLLAAVCIISAFSPLNGWLAGKLNEKRPVFTTVKMLAKHEQNLTSYATAVKVDPVAAKNCDAPTINNRFKIPVVNYTFTPVPTLTEFVISESEHRACIVVYEHVNKDSPINKADPVFKDIRREDYAAIFGNVISEKMVRVNKIGYNFSNQVTEERDLTNLYASVPWVFPVGMTKEGGSFQTNYIRYLRQYTESVFKELRKDEKMVWVGFLSVGTGALVAFFLVLYRLQKMYSEYSEDMRNQGLPIAKFRYFLEAGDIAELTEELLFYRKKNLRADNEKREAARRGRRQERASLVTAPISGEETPEMRLARRQQKIDLWCQTLRDLTPTYPPSEMLETERICRVASGMASIKFDEAKEVITSAISGRKRLNQEQGVVIL